MIMNLLDIKSDWHSAFPDENIKHAVAVDLRHSFFFFNRIRIQIT